MTDWTAPAPGPWQQDSAHTPVSQTLIARELYPEGFNRGFTETFARYGLLLDRLAMAEVNGFTYHQPQPFDLPGPDGPKSPEELGAEFGRRAGLADETLAIKRWRQDLNDWDEVAKPASITRHRELGAVDLAGLDDDGLRAHLDDVAANYSEMVYQHHRNNMAAIFPVGDMALHVAAWTGRPPIDALGLLDGYSPISAVLSSEMTEALDAIRDNERAIDLCVSAGDAAARLTELRALVPAVDDYVTMVQDRPVEGFDVISPTLREQPGLILGKLASALMAEPDVAKKRADDLAAELRSEVPAEHRAAFDELLAEARLVYRLRDERGIYSDITGVGLVRRALREFGRRAHERGHLTHPDEVFDATVTEAKALLDGDGPSADELISRGIERQRLTAEGPPRFLGDPMPPPPPIDELPPGLRRIMGATGFMIDAILGQLDAPVGDDALIGGVGVTQHVAEGRARLIRQIDDLLELEPGDVIVASATTEAFNSVLHMVSGIITDHGSHACHAAIVAREMGFPAVVGTIDATRRIPDGARVRLDGAKGEITVLP